MAADEAVESQSNERAHIRKARKWVMIVMGATMIAILAWAMGLGRPANQNIGAPTGLAVDTPVQGADAAACAALQGGLDAVSSGTPLGTAMNSVIGQGWPNGQPSEAVRGVYNAFRSAVAAEANYLDGVGTFEQATGAFQDAFTAYQAICQ